MLHSYLLDPAEPQTDLMKKGLRRGDVDEVDAITEPQTDLMKKGLRQD